MELLGFDEVYKLLKNKTKTLGSGAFGTVTLVNWHGEPAALKVANGPKALNSFEREVQVLSELKGAGGAPLLLGVSYDPLALLTTYKGSTNLDKIMCDPRYDLIKIGFEIGIKLLQVHNKGYVHNDIKSDNIMIQGSPHEPKISVIDFGLACKSGENIYLGGDPEDYPFYAPEVLGGQPSTFASDVFSYGRLMQDILEVTNIQHPPLEQMFQEAMRINADWRPFLPNLLRRLQDQTRDASTDSTYDQDRKRIHRYAQRGLERDGLRMIKEQIFKNSAGTEGYLCRLRHMCGLLSR